MKYYEALEIYNDICKKVIESPEEWMQFLDASQGIYKYSFKEQLMIAAQRPDATAVADIAFWNKKMGRYVKKNSTGIAVFTEKADSNQKLRYVYDRSDTELSWYGGHEVHPWQVEKTEDYAMIADAIVNATGIEVPNESAIEDVFYYVTAATVSDQEDVDELVDSTALKGSELSKKEKNDQSSCLSALIVASAAYLMIGRCGLDPRAYISREEFKEVSLLTSKSALINFGNIYTDYAQSILQFVEKESNKLAIKHRRDEAEKTTEAEEIPQAESETNPPVHEPDVEDQKEENTLEEITPGVPVEVEVHGKPDQKQLTLFEPLPSIEEQRGTLATEAPKAADISEGLMTDALINRVLMSAGGGRGAADRRLEIAAYWQKGHSINDFAAFLEDKIGIAGQGFQFDGKKLCAWYDSNGLRLSYFPSAVENPMKTLTWTEIASRTDRLIRTGAYLSSEEVDAIRQHELKRIGEEIYFVFRDTIADMHKDIFNDLAPYSGAPEHFVYFEKMLSSPQGVNQLLAVLKSDIDKIKTGEIKLRSRLVYTPESIMAELEDLLKDPKEIQKTEKVSLLYENFITQDEVDYALKEGGNVEGSFKRIYNHFSQHKKDAKDDSAFLAKEYGEGGTFGRKTIENIHYAPSKEIEIAKRLPNGQKIELNINYRQVAKRIRYLIEHNLFQTPEPQRSVMPAEPTEQQEPAGNSDENHGEYDQPAERFETPDPETDVEAIKEELSQVIEEIKDERAAEQALHTELIDKYGQTNGQAKTLFDQFQSLFPEFLDNDCLYERRETENDAFMPLVLEKIAYDTSYNTFVMTHYYRQNGDLVTDPEIVYLFDVEKEALVPLTYENGGLGIYQSVIEEGEINEGLVHSLQQFSSSWLDNISEQGYQPVKRVVNREGEEVTIDFTEAEVIPEDAEEGQETDEAAFSNAAEISKLPTEPGEIKEESDSPTHPIRRFMRTWGLENCSTFESLEIMRQHHQPGKQDMDDRGELSNLMNRAQQDYAQTANADVAALSWIKYRNAFRQAFYELADDICQGKATEKVTIGFTEAEIIPEDAEEESATDRAAFSFDQKKENTEESPQETGWTPKFEVSQGGSNDEPQNRQSDVTPQQGENFIIGPDTGDSHFNPTERIRKNIAAIQMLKQIEAEGRMADDDEKAVINAYVGWGGLADIFDHRKQTWKEEKEALKSMLSPSEYAAAEGSILNAHYTDPGIISAMYEAVQLFGFSIGNVLEPACGTGRFIGTMPMALRESKVYGVELDELSGRMAKALYPKAEITINGFENTYYPINFFDLAIGNVPFGNYKVADTKYDKLNFQIHDYFIAKTLDLVRPGGIIAFITSKGTMDKQNSSVRQYIARRAELIGAVRLPNNAFSGANTKVTADVLFFQKLESMRDLNAIDWIDLKEDENGLKYNAYFVDHPEYVVGEMVEISGPYGSELACQAAKGSDTIQNVRDVIFDMAVSHRNIYENRTMAEATQDQDVIPATPDVRNFTYTMVNGSIYYRNNSVLIEQEVTGTKAERIEHLIEVRDAVYRLIDAEVSGESPRLIKEYQNELNRIYDHFAKKYGRIGRQANKLAFSEDCTYPMLLSLEVNDGEGNFLRKADIFSKITIRKKQEIDHADNPVDALSISLAEKGGVDFEYMQQLTGEDEGTLQSGLKGFIFKNPESDTWESADAYLSGNIRQKLSAAQAAVEKGEETYLENVEALKKVMPEPLKASEISIVMGSTWVDKKYYEQFLFELLQPAERIKEKIELFYSEETGSWQILGKNLDFGNILSLRTYGTERVNAYYLFESCMNLKDAKIYDLVDNKRVVNQDETVLANNKQKLIREAFKDWIYEDFDRREDLVNTYNQLFNNNRPREYDGSNLPCVGLNPDIMLRQNQLDVAARIIYGENTGVFHCVGAGKTLASIVGIMESHRLGLTHKALFVVPNHLIEQWSIEFMRAYPASRILVSTKKDFQPINRKVFCSKIATGNWDAVIIGQSQFEKIPVSFERQERLLNEQIDAIDLEIDFSENQYTKKQLIAARKRVEASLKKLTDQSKKDQVINFEQLGIDALVVDEAQRYKNLFTYSKMGDVAGINQTDSKRASDMLMKCQYMDEITGGRGITFLTGTPVSNSISELHTMMRYLQADLLRELRMESFDSWASVFTEKVTKMELAPQGGNNFRMKSRLGKYNNLPELISFFKNSADIKTPDMLNLPVPMVHFENIVLKPSPAQKALVESLGARADRVHAGAVDRSKDNFLKITSDGRKAALDIRLFDPDLPEDEYSKAQAIAQNVFKIWSETDGAQLVFCDLSTPKPDHFNVYDDIKSKLIRLGIPEKEIAFIHDAGTDKQKTALFKKVRKADVRVLMGSTEKMGAGMNAQDKLIALHHADCPWRPADLEQQEGRIVRQGNQYEEVNVYRYITEGTFDAYSWQVIEQKQQFISQIMTSRSPARSIEDVDLQTLNYAEIKALATSNPLVKEKMELEIRLTELNTMKAAYRNQKYEMEHNLAKVYPKRQAALTARQKNIERDHGLFLEQKVSMGSKFKLNVNGHDYFNPEEAGKAFQKAHYELLGVGQLEKKIAEYCGLDIYVKYDFEAEKREMTIRTKHGSFYKYDFGRSAAAAITALDKVDDFFVDQKKEINDAMVSLEKQIEDASQLLDTPFGYEEELEEKNERLKEVMIELFDNEVNNKEIEDIRFSSIEDSEEER